MADKIKFDKISIVYWYLKKKSMLYCGSKP